MGDTEDKEIFRQDILFPDLSIISSDSSGFGCGQTIINPKTWTRQTPSFPSSSTVKHIPDGQAKVIFKQINTALLMHKNGVFHQDLKLDNILVNRNKGTPEIRVIDFGCGDFVANEPFRKFCGTPAFAPPEVFLGETYKAEATTVWQIGAMLYITCTRANFDTLVYMKEDNKVLKNVSKECNDFLSKCLALDPKQRPTLEDLLLHPWLDGLSSCCSNLLLPPRQNQRPPAAGSVHAFSVQRRWNKVLLMP
uniref:non-specific serine/threonine protein kinase n=1 Tax=Gouania willdenowi TaxID=441366 RepID=A0A8C5G989_GOUWI